MTDYTERASKVSTLRQDVITALQVSEEIKKEKEQYKNAENISEIEYKGDIDMKNIILRSDGRYMVHKQVNGKRVNIYTKTLKEAVKIRDKQIIKKALSCERKKPKTEFTLKEWADEWLNTYKKPFIKWKNYQVIETIFNNEINKKIGHLKLNNLTTFTIQNFYNTYPTSRKKERIILYLNACLQKAFENRFIPINPCLGVVKDKKLKYEKKPFTIEEQAIILEKIKNTDIEPYIYFYLLTGIRKNEFNPHFIEDDLDITNNRIRAINEKQHSILPVYKFIDLNPNYIQLLLTQKDKFIYSPEVIGRKFKKILDELKIDGGLHKLRHTFATNYYYLGVPEKVISNWLGHSTLNVTQDIYIGITNKNIKQELLKLYNNLLYEF